MQRDKGLSIIPTACKVIFLRPLRFQIFVPLHFLKYENRITQSR